MSDQPPADLTARVARALDALAPAGARCLVAVSGGPDSLALLDLLHRGAALHRRPLAVAHIDHGISPSSHLVADAVLEHARRLDLPCSMLQLALGPGCSETRAREARREALRSLAVAGGHDAIVLGHHADDQAETILLRLLRGSGPAGLAGMAPRQGIWIRPLLTIPRQDLADHLAAHGLRGWADPANSDPRHLRSWLRTAIFPQLTERLPDLPQRLLRAGAQAARARRAWNAVPALVPALELASDADGISVAAPPLGGYRSEVRHAVLAAIGRRMGVPLGTRRLEAIDRLLLGKRGTGAVRLSGRLEVELSFGRLTFHEVVPSPSPAEVELDRQGRLVIGCSELRVSTRPAAEVSREGWSTSLSPGRYVARTWRPGDRIRPLGGAGSRPLGVLFREARISRRRRPDWPVIATVEDATIVWVPGICRSDSRIPAPETEALHVECALS